MCRAVRANRLVLPGESHCGNLGDHRMRWHPLRHTRAADRLEVVRQRLVQPLEHLAYALSGPPHWRRRRAGSAAGSAVIRIVFLARSKMPSMMMSSGSAPRLKSVVLRRLSAGPGAAGRADRPAPGPGLTPGRPAAAEAAAEAASSASVTDPAPAGRSGSAARPPRSRRRAALAQPRLS